MKNKPFERRKTRRSEKDIVRDLEYILGILDGEAGYMYGACDDFSEVRPPDRPEEVPLPLDEDYRGDECEFLWFEKMGLDADPDPETVAENEHFGAPVGTGSFEDIVEKFRTKFPGYSLSISKPDFVGFPSGSGGETGILAVSSVVVYDESGRAVISFPATAEANTRGGNVGLSLFASACILLSCAFDAEPKG